MFKLHRIEINDFRSYRGNHTFTFPTQTGLFYFTGINDLEDVGANGTGKSTFMDAITWCLYGVTTRGLKGSDVLAGWSGSSSVGVSCTVDKRRALVLRTQKPNSLTLDGVPVDQQELEKFLCLNYRSFISSVISPQFGTPFFALTPAEKLNVFSDIMNLDFWLECSKQAAVASGALEDYLNDIREKLIGLESSLAAAKIDLNDLELREKAWKREVKNKKHNLTVESKALLAAKDVCSNRLNAVGRGIRALGGTRSAEAIKLNSLEATRDERLELLQLNIQDRVKVEERTKFLEERVDNLKKFPKVCPACNQDVDHEHILNEVKAAVYQHTGSVRQLTRWVTEVEAIKSRLVKTNLAIDAKIDEINKLTDDLNELKQEERRLEDEFKRLQDQRDLLQNEINAQPVNPYTELVSAKRDTVRESSAALQATNENRKSVEATHVATSYWIKGFKQIRLQIIETAFAALEIEVNNCLSQLGMQGWQISFDVERENKSGGVTKGFMVLVKSPSNKDPVKWENWSGGETQRLQLAGALGLANLIMQQAGLTNTIEFFDESTVHMSQEGITDLLQLLHERALNDGKQIWVVDHNVLTFSDFTGTITVIKDEQGSRIDGPR